MERIIATNDRLTAEKKHILDLNFKCAQAIFGLEDTIDRLTAELKAKDEELAKLKKLLKSEMEAMNALEQIEPAELKAKDKRIANLKKYVQHKPSCNLLSLIPITIRNGKKVGCDCGFEQALKGKP